MLKNTHYKLAAFALVFCMGLLVGCDDDNSIAKVGGCQFNLFEFFNGPNPGDQVSEWQCTIIGEPGFTFALFADETGTSTDIGTFTFTRPGCTTLDIFTAGEEASWENLDGSIQKIGGVPVFGSLSFNQVSDDFGDFVTNCQLNVF